MRFGLRPKCRAQSNRRLCALQFLRIWRHQRRAHFQALGREVTDIAGPSDICHSEANRETCPRQAGFAEESHLIKLLGPGIVEILRASLTDALRMTKKEDLVQADRYRTR